MKSVEVFITDVQELSQAKYLTTMIGEVFPEYSVNFDLEDSDKILRVKSSSIDSTGIIRLLTSKNFKCEVLE